MFKNSNFEEFNAGDEVDYTVRAIVLAVDESGIAFLNTGQAVHIDNLKKVYTVSG